MTSSNVQLDNALALLMYNSTLNQTKCFDIDKLIKSNLLKAEGIKSAFYALNRDITVHLFHVIHVLVMQCEASRRQPN
jgi:hypothetical protein